MNPLVWVIVLSLSPIFELRGAIPYGILHGLNPALVFTLSVALNILLIPVIFLVLSFLFEIIFKIPILGKGLHKAMDRAHRKALPYLDKYGIIGLTLFVAVPLPVTGAYSGCLVAHLLEMDKKRAMPAIAIGVLIAGILVTLASTGVINFIKPLL